MTDTDMLYMASLEKRNAELEAKVAELESKHWNECRQIARYDDELRKAKRLLMIAVEHFRQIGTNAEYDDERGYGCVLTDEHGCGEGVCPLDSGDECKWRHEAEALALIGEDTNVPVREDGDTNG